MKVHECAEEESRSKSAHRGGKAKEIGGAPKRGEICWLASSKN